MMVKEAIEICCWMVVYDKTYFIDAHLLVCYTL